MSSSTIHRINLENPLTDTSSTSQTELPFTFQDVKGSIPSECFTPNVWRSLAYFFADTAIIIGLYATAAYLDAWWFYPIFGLLRGQCFGLFS